MSFVIVVLVLFVLLAQLTESCNFEDAHLVRWAKERIKTLGNCSVLSAGFDPIKYQAPTVKIFVYHNDEHEVIADFLQYHSYAFGAKNIIVVDQNSQLESVCKTLALFQSCGTEVITTTGTFYQKGAFLTSVMAKHKHTLLLPLDSDEFILPYSAADPVKIDRDELWRAFRNLPIDGRKYKYQMYSNLMPNTSACASSFNAEDAEYRRAVKNELFLTMYVAGPRTKSFYHSHGFIYTDDGNHYGRVAHDKGIVNVHPDIAKNLTQYFAVLQAQMLHLPLGGYRGAKDKYTRAAEQMGYTSDTNCSSPDNIVNTQYCVPSKLFVNGSDHGAQFYMNSCKHHSRAAPNSNIASWFRHHTLSLQELTGLTSL